MLQEKKFNPLCALFFIFLIYPEAPLSVYVQPEAPEIFSPYMGFAFSADYTQFRSHKQGVGFAH